MEIHKTISYFSLSGLVKSYILKFLKCLLVSVSIKSELINAFESVAGSATIVRSANGTPVLNASVKYVDEKTGGFKSVDMDPIVYNKAADINTIYEEYYNLFYQQALLNYKLKRNASQNTE